MLSSTGIRCNDGHAYSDLSIWTGHCAPFRGQLWCGQHRDPPVRWCWLRTYCYCSQSGTPRGLKLAAVALIW